MADYAITGKKGTGKSLFAVGVARDAIRAGKRVATNLDIYLDQLVSPTSKTAITRLPDRPTAADMIALGRGQPGKVEDDNGIIILDETSTFFNSRSFGDKERQPLLDWLVHSRKLGWDVYYICQGLGQIDKQLRESMIEYHIAVKRTDKWPIPFVTPFLKLFGLNVRLPKMHVGTVRYGCANDSLIVDRKWYRAKDLYNAYDTQQVFLDRNHPQACGIHSVLSPWHTKGRYLPKVPPLFLRFIYGVLGHDWTKQPAPVKRLPKHQLAQMLSKLPPDQAIKHWHRLNALGAFNAA